MDKEASTPFHEHMLLEKHLNADQLQCNPLASFLNLVCLGLAQNPYFTVEQKREHLEWFKEYFKDKIPAINASVEEEIRLTKLEREARGETQWRWQLLNGLQFWRVCIDYNFAECCMIIYKAICLTYRFVFLVDCVCDVLRWELFWISNRPSEHQTLLH